MEKDNTLTCSTVFPDRLSDLINEKQKLGISQNVIAEKLEVSKSVLSEWASGKKKPSLKNLCNLSQYFGVSADYLLGITDARSVEPDIRAIQEYTGLSDNALKTLRFFNGFPVAVPFLIGSRLPVKSDSVISFFNELFTDEGCLGLLSAGKVVLQDGEFKIIEI